MLNIKDIQKEYKDKLIDADFAAGLVKSNMRIHFGVGTDSSVYMDKALGERLRHDNMLRGLEIQSETAIRHDDFETYKAVMDNVDVARFYSSHFSSRDRQMMDRGNSWHVPILFSEESLYWGPGR